MISDNSLNVFCFLGRLKFTEQLESVLGLLSETEKEKALRIHADIKELPKAELLRRWSNLRAEEYGGLIRDIRQRSGIRIDEIPPSLREQWVDWLRKRHE